MQHCRRRCAGRGCRGSRRGMRDRSQRRRGVRTGEVRRGGIVEARGMGNDAVRRRGRECCGRESGSGSGFGGRVDWRFHCRRHYQRRRRRSQQQGETKRRTGNGGRAEGDSGVTECNCELLAAVAAVGHLLEKRQAQQRNGRNERTDKRASGQRGRADGGSERRGGGRRSGMGRQSAWPDDDDDDAVTASTGTHSMRHPAHPVTQALPNQGTERRRLAQSLRKVRLCGEEGRSAG